MKGRQQIQLWTLDGSASGASIWKIYISLSTHMKIKWALSKELVCKLHWRCSRDWTIFRSAKIFYNYFPAITQIILQLQIGECLERLFPRLLSILELAQSISNMNSTLCVLTPKNLIHESLEDKCKIISAPTMPHYIQILQCCSEY